MKKNNDSIALFNFGASFIMMSIWFIIMALYIIAYNGAVSVVSQYSKMGISTTSMNDSIGEISGRLWLSVFFFAASLAAAIFGMAHARDCVKGIRAKTTSGLVSTASSAIVWGYASINSIITMCESKSAAMTASSDVIKTLAAAFSSEWIVWVIMLFEVVATVTAVVGFISVITAPSRAITVDSKDGDTSADLIGSPVSVVQQFAKPEKKDLPPMLNGDQDDSAAATINPSISGLRSIAPTEQSAPTAPDEPAANNADGNHDAIV